jgi:hypothetical protein
VSRLEDVVLTATWINGSIGARMDVGGDVDTAIGITVEGGAITRIHAIRNPHKLAGLGAEVALGRT